MAFHSFFIQVLVGVPKADNQIFTSQRYLPLFFPVVIFQTQRPEAVLSYFFAILFKDIFYITQVNVY